MTNPFTEFVFDATGETQSPNVRTLPDRLAEIKNVKDFGATGAGFPTDDWAAIIAAFNWGQVTLTASGPNSGNVIPFASVPTSVVGGSLMVANDVTNPSVLIARQVTSVDHVGNTVTVAGLSGSISTNDSIEFSWLNKGIIYFPPGNYYVSQPIDLNVTTSGSLNDLQSSIWTGELGASTITGNFSDYVIRKNVSGSDYAQDIVIDKLNIMNTNASGGGIRLGATTNSAIRNCTVTANKGINTYGIDNSNIDGGSLSVSIENCDLSPGSNFATASFTGTISGNNLTVSGVTGTIAIGQTIIDGSNNFAVKPCQIVSGSGTSWVVGGSPQSVGPVAMLANGSQGILAFANGPITNCRIIGFVAGLQAGSAQGEQVVNGCYFANCLTGMSLGYLPDTIDGNEEAALVVAGCWFKNNSVAIGTTGAGCQGGSYIGLRIEAAAGQAPGGANAQYGLLLGNPSGGTSANFSLFAGITITGTYDVAGALVPGGGQSANNTFMSVNSVSWIINSQNLTGERDQFIATNVGAQNVYTVANLPGAGNGVVEGDCYNVKDGTNGLLWGATVTNTGTHTTHYKTRYNGSNFTVVGQ